ncbi:MAG: hypothetical protein JWO88_336 [Frankiales bacterium]|jgi:GrpB-like predicted nucleotidyltransferase (UPF0157 family)|nr:hypothetical protein [Frankiales bacterium]
MPDVVRPYDPAWAVSFEEERVLLREALAPWLLDDVHHVGSTAVPGMLAKPAIDMIAGVRDLDEARAAVGPLLALDYHYRPHRPEAHLFDKPVLGDWAAQTHHLHLTEPESDLWRERLAFRDALRADPDLVAEYSAWKRAHATRRGDDLAYDETKWPLVSRVLTERGIPLKTDAQRLTP